MPFDNSLEVDWDFFVGENVRIRTGNLDRAAMELEISDGIGVGKALIYIPFRHYDAVENDSSCHENNDYLSRERRDNRCSTFPRL